MSDRSRRFGVFTLAVALCVQLGLEPLRVGLPLLLQSLSFDWLLVSVEGLGVVSVVVQLALLVGFFLVARSVWRARIAGVIGIALFVGRCVAFGVGSSPTSWGPALYALSYVLTVVACWLALGAATRARGRTVPALLTAVLTVGVLSNLGAAVAVAVARSCSTRDVGFAIWVASFAGPVSGMLLPAAQLAVVFPLTRR